MLLRRLVTLLAAVALAAGLPAPAAHAAATHAGECHLVAVSHPTVTGQDMWEGVVYAHVAVYGDDVVSATVTCRVVVNGATVRAFSGSGTGVIAFAVHAWFVADRTSTVVLCTDVDYLSDPTPTSSQCSGASVGQIPPQEVYDLAGFVIDLAEVVKETADPYVCLALKLLPNVGPVTTGPDGDVYVNGARVYDCPSYSGSPLVVYFGEPLLVMTA